MADFDDDNRPCLNGLIAGTLALMTGWADPAPDARVDEATQRRLMAKKIASNLGHLETHPALPGRMRQVMEQARQRWAQLAGSAAAETAAASAAARQLH